eukprot:TRINITY_DN211_c0_g1_i1.p1 TRINITY_DN211_c0_g1~~TRINITY_DN211_c0_g1_i1.p1  ORF type:complete len:187 (+),score=47.59 TRINITY_DN211_c0_g1_i1:151-711(+)
MLTIIIPPFTINSDFEEYDENVYISKISQFHQLDANDDITFVLNEPEELSSESCVLVLMGSSEDELKPICVLNSGLICNTIHPSKYEFIKNVDTLYFCAAILTVDESKEIIFEELVEDVDSKPEINKLVEKAGEFMINDLQKYIESYVVSVEDTEVVPLECFDEWVTNWNDRIRLNPKFYDHVYER